MKIVNYQSEIRLIHDGFEDALLKNDKEVKCPCCDSIVYFGLYNSESLDVFDERKRTHIVGGIKGLKFIEGEIKEYRYKNSPLRVLKTKCSNGLHNIVVVFTYKETQPARYASYLVGLFDDESINK
ncbi:hypothetical protein LQK91_06665 [Pantoea sp. MHSD4]|jgi:hypothetical protein|uniref:hypothetical protein n=1 Tax=Pantoea sp. MHSD4 TaxID=2898077 RepID=UPI000CF48001|nr:hypothetical protein [Pantoea sp. MHSD4]MCD2356107.1 hypothetical protein [Pantoea sp. MHSD4]PQL30315.1 hypothetical protein C5L22_06695 [Pantoea ananatis]